MALIKSYRGLAPKWGRDCYFSENATIVGDVTMGDECSVWFNAVVRGDVAPITIGNCTNIQDGSCVHVTFDTGPTHIGNYVTIGHNVTVHACPRAPEHEDPCRRNLGRRTSQVHQARPSRPD